MGKRTLVLVLALVLAAVSAFAVWRFLSEVEENVAADFVEIKVFRATQIIETGTDGEVARTFIEASTALSTVLELDTSRRILCSGVEIRTGDEDPTLCDDQPANLQDAVNGKVAAGPISAGQLITTDMFVTAAELNTIFLSEDIPQGKVAIAIRPGEAESVGGFLRPGDRINIIASASIQLNQLVALVSDPVLRELVIDLGLGEPPPPPVVLLPGELPPEEDEETVDPLTAFVATLPSALNFTQTVLQDIEVIAVGPDTRLAPLGTGLEPQGTQIVILEVTPDQAEEIEFARQNTSVALTLLPKDLPYTKVETDGVLIDDLFDLLERIREQLEQVGATLGS